MKTKTLFGVVGTVGLVAGAILSKDKINSGKNPEGVSANNIKDTYDGEVTVIHLSQGTDLAERHLPDGQTPGRVR